jgi:hypothetical protein
MLPTGASISTEGAPERCHYVVEGHDDDILWTFFESVSGGESISQFSICPNGQARPVTLNEVLSIRQAFKDAEKAAAKGGKQK